MNPETPNFNPEDREASQEKPLEETSVDELLNQDLKDEDILGEILRRGNEKQLQELREKTDSTKEELELSTYYADQREEVLDEMEENLEERKEENPEPDEFEQRLGAYREQIEPQVGEAISTLREKGYNTVSSGFDGPAAQQIAFKENGYLEDFDQNQLKEEMKEKGVELEFDPRSVTFLCREKFSLDELEEIWNTIAEKLPDLGHSADKADSREAEIFRRKRE